MHTKKLTRLATNFTIQATETDLSRTSTHVTSTSCTTMVATKGTADSNLVLINVISVINHGLFCFFFLFSCLFCLFMKKTKTKKYLKDGSQTKKKCQSVSKNLLLIQKEHHNTVFQLSVCRETLSILRIPT